MQTQTRNTTWNSLNYSQPTRALFLSSGLLPVLMVWLAAFLTPQCQSATIDKIEITEGPHSLGSIVHIWREATDRQLLISPQIKGDLLKIGPLSLPKEDMKELLVVVLTQHGYTITEAAKDVDMLSPQTVKLLGIHKTEIYMLTYVTAKDIIENLSKLLSPVQTFDKPLDQPRKAQEINTGGQHNVYPQIPPAVVAEITPNSVMVRGSEQELEIAKSFIETVDVQTQMVDIRAIIGQVTLGDKYETGIDFINALDDFTAGNGGPGVVVLPLHAKAKAATIYGNVGAFSRYIKLTEEDSDFSITARPSMAVKSGFETTITSGQKIPYPETTLTQAQGTASTSATIAFQEVLLSLKVGATILPSRRIRLTIDQKNDGVQSHVIISGSQVPSLSAQSIVSEIEIQDGETIALGGIITSQTTGNRRGVRGLSRIPILGRLFKTKSQSTSEQELIIFIEAKIKD